MKVIKYLKSTGQIVMAWTAQSEDIPEEDSEYGYALVDDFSLEPVSWFDEGVVHFGGQPPSTAHTWIWTTKTWDLDLELARAQAWARIKQARDACEFGLFNWNGYTFDGDERTRGRLGIALEGAKEAIAAADTTWAEGWKLANNDVLQLSAADFLEVVRAHGAVMKVAHATAAVLAYFIDSATTLEQLDAVQWPSG